MRPVLRLLGRMRFNLRKLIVLILSLSLAIIWNEVMIFYLVIGACRWPDVVIDEPNAGKPINMFMISDPHLLGVYKGHWLDKLRREWQMYRSFQTSIQIHNPDAVFFLGDIFDEGQWANEQQFDTYTDRFNEIFYTPKNIHKQVVVGNHDIGFHYRIWDPKRKLFESTFRSGSVKLLKFKGLIFVMLNSMAMEEDGCNMCAEAEAKLKKISHRLQCSVHRNMGYEVPCEDAISPISSPILLQHFPMYRDSEAICNEPDSAPESIKHNRFQEKWDCLSKSATAKLIKWIKPRAVFGGHSHHGCFRYLDDGTPEWTVPSYSWRNRNDPSFMMVSATKTQLNVNKCFLPRESTVIIIYVAVVIFNVLYMCNLVSISILQGFLQSIRHKLCN